jgi:hypothetical protein
VARGGCLSFPRKKSHINNAPRADALLLHTPHSSDKITEFYTVRSLIPWPTVQESVFSEDADSAGMSLAALGQKRVGKECFMQASSRLTLNSASVALLFSRWGRRS